MGRSAAARQTAADQLMEAPMLRTNDLSRSVTPFKQGNTLIAVIEMSLSSWLVAGIVPGMERHPLKTLTRTRCSDCCIVGARKQSRLAA
jgi:hypothetical protein